MQKRYSYTGLNLFKTCPRKYKFLYLQKIKIPDRVSASLYMGSAVHRQLARAYSIAADGVLYPLEDMLASYRAEWSSMNAEKLITGNEYLTMEDFIRNGEAMLRQFHEKYQPFNQGTLLSVEKNFSFCLPGTPFNFVARVDRLWKRDDGVVEICDYKTGKNLPLGPADPTFLSQMGLYQLAVTSAYPRQEPIELVQHFLRHDEKIAHRMLPEELDELTEQLRQAVLEIIRAQRLDEFPTREGGHCTFCEYTHLCPAKRHQMALETPTGAGTEERTDLVSIAQLADDYIEADTRYRQFKGRRDTLREEILQKTSELGLEKVVGTDADLSVRTTSTEEFPTKTEDEDAYIRLTQLVRGWRLEESFVLDTKALMKDFYLTERLSPDRLVQLKAFVNEKQRSRVTLRRHRRDEEEI